MRLEGSCHCRAVRFKVEAHTPYPYNRCYCSICRKTAGGGGYAINIMGEANSLKIEGGEHIAIYQARIDGQPSDSLRHFCKRCGSALWIWSPPYPNWIYPFASAIDTPLPAPPERTHLMLEFKAPWVELDAPPADKRFDGYLDKGIADWHKARGLWRD